MSNGSDCKISYIPTPILLVIFASINEISPIHALKTTELANREIGKITGSIKKNMIYASIHAEIIVL